MSPEDGLRCVEDWQSETSLNDASLSEAGECGSNGLVTWSSVDNIAPSPHHGPGRQILPLSVLDQLAAPTVFMEACFVYRGPVERAILRAALQAVIDRVPVLAARVSQQGGGRGLVLDSASAGVAFLQGSAPGLHLQQLLRQAGVDPAAAPAAAGGSSSSQQRCELLPEFPALTEAVFGGLPGALAPEYVDRADMPLTHVAVVTLQQQQQEPQAAPAPAAPPPEAGEAGFILGLRISHLACDWASLRLVLRAISAEYSRRVLAAVPAGLTPAGGQLPAAATDACELLSSAAEALNSLVQAAALQLPTGFMPVRFKPLQPEDEAVFQQLGQLSSSSGPGDSSSSSAGGGGPVRLAFHAPPARIQQLKQQAIRDLQQHDQPATAAEGDGATGGDTGQGSSGGCAIRACSAHNVLLARVLQVFGRLPGWQRLPHDVSVAVDMRRRLLLPSPAAQQQQQDGDAQPGQQKLSSAVGNFFASAIAEGLVLSSEEASLGRLAQAVADAIARGSDLWLPDHAWAAQVLGLVQAAAADQQQQQQQQQQVTWRRLHAMGPRSLLEQQMALGLLASLSTTQWPLDHAADACLAGQLPLVAVPGFSRPQPYPLLLQQAAPAAMGGGVLLLVFLDGCEAALFARQAAAEGGL